MINSLPWCQIFDLDGTLALHTSGRSPFEWERVNEDTVNEHVAYLTRLRLSDRVWDHVIILSGRSDICRTDTLNWLCDNEDMICFHELHMRTHNDMRCDTIIKRELYDKYIKDKYRVRFIVDDRPKVCRMWRDLGLNVLQVGDPHMEF